MKTSLLYYLSILLMPLFSGCHGNHHTQAVEKNYSSETIYRASCSELKSDHIPDSVWKMTNLRELSIMGMDCDTGSDSCWAVSVLPPEIGNLTNLETLRLNVNAISNLPAEMSKLTKLKELVLDDNLSLQNIEAICQLPNLEHLSLFGCGLRKLPVIIRLLTRLKTIGLTGNPLTEKDIEVLHRALPDCKIIFEQ